MIEAILVSLLAVVLAYCARLYKGEKWLRLSILVLTVFLSIGYNWGNDVVSYEAMFINAKDYGGSLFDFSGGGSIVEKGELGWVVLNRLCLPIGFWGMRILLFCFEGFVIYRLIKHYVSRDYYWMAVFFYAFNNTLMVMGSSMMRQYLAMCITALAFDILIQSINKHDRIRNVVISIIVYVVLIYFASLFHRSALFVLPACLLVFFRFDFSRRSILMLLVVAAIWFTFGYTLLLSAMSGLMSDLFDVYSDYGSIGGSLGVGVAFYVLLYVFIFSQFKMLTKEQKILCSFASISILILPFVSMYEYITRIALYFSLFSIVVYPIFFKSVSKNNLRHLIIPLFLLVLYSYWGFFHNRVWFDAYYHYTTIFSVGGWR